MKKLLILFLMFPSIHPMMQSFSYDDLFSLSKQIAQQEDDIRKILLPLTQDYTNPRIIARRLNQYIMNHCMSFSKDYVKLQSYFDSAVHHLNLPICTIELLKKSSCSHKPNMDHFMHTYLLCSQCLANMIKTN